MSSNLAPTYGSIAGFSAGTSLVYARLLIDNNVSCSHNYSYIGTPPYPKFVIIDLKTDRLITGFKLWGYTCSIDVTKSVKDFRVELLANSVSGSAFTQVASSRVPITRVIGGIVFPGTQTLNITPTAARWVKLDLDSNWGNTNELWAAEFEIYGEAVVTSTTSLISNAEITNAFLKTDAFVYTPTYITTTSLNADAQIIRFDPGAQRFSDALIVGPWITTNSVIIASSSAALLSNTFVYRGAYHVKSIITVGKANVNTLSTRGIILYNNLLSTSEEVIVNDLITSGNTLNTILDLNALNLPLGHQNYDWAYDWVIRTYNNAQYKLEARSADTLTELNTLPFSRIFQGQLILRGNVKKYHQWRCHVWASGSGDFELHQFTVKAYVNNPINPLYRALYDKDFGTISTIVRNVQNAYEPIDTQISLEPYTPGDVNADGIINNADTTYLLNYIYVHGSMPIPLAAGDVNGDGLINLLDITTLNSYINSRGMPPKRKI